MEKIEPITLTDGTKLVPLDDKEKESLEAEIKTILDKYGAMYLPAIRNEDSLTSNTQRAVLFLLKKVEQEPVEIISPFTEDNG